MDQPKNIPQKDEHTASPQIEGDIRSTLKSILKLNPFFVYEKFTGNFLAEEVAPVYEKLYTNVNSCRVPYFTAGLLHIRQAISYTSSMYFLTFSLNLVKMRSKKFPMVSTVSKTNAFFSKNWAPIFMLANVPCLAIIAINNQAIDSETQRVFDLMQKTPAQLSD